MEIGDKTISACVGVLQELLDSYRKELDEAYRKSDDTIKISLGLKIIPADRGGNTVEGSISFVKERIKDTSRKTVFEKQQELVFGEPLRIIINEKDQKTEIQQESNNGI